MISDGKNRFMMRGLNRDIVECWQACYERFKNQPNDLKLLDNIRGYSVERACEAIYDYMIKYTYYKLDRAGEQLIKSPGRFLKDGCGDCKSYTMFIASCLHCLGIPCIVRFVNFDGGGQYTHVYPVAIDEGGNEIILDACELDEDGVVKFGFARPYAEKLDIVYGR